MHAYLFTGNNAVSLTARINLLSDSLKTNKILFPVIKIEDIRNLNSLIQLSFSEPTLIIIENINLISEEAANAFLKNLEEPQQNIYFALTAPSELSVLSTIVSRCQVIKVQSTEYKVQSDDTENFIKMSKTEKLSFLDKIKDRDTGVKFIESLIFFLHHKKDLTNMEILIKTLTNLKKNGIVSLHLTNLVARMESTHDRGIN